MAQDATPATTTDVFDPLANRSNVPGLGSVRKTNRYINDMISRFWATGSLEGIKREVDLPTELVHKLMDPKLSRQGYKLVG
jgi:hypothetical protein